MAQCKTLRWRLLRWGLTLTEYVVKVPMDPGFLCDQKDQKPSSRAQQIKMQWALPSQSMNDGSRCVTASHLRQLQPMRNSNLEDQFLSSAGAEKRCVLPITPAQYWIRILRPRFRNYIQYWGWSLKEGSCGISRQQICTGKTLICENLQHLENPNLLK